MQQAPLIPDTITVAQQPLLAVQLPDGTIGAVFSYLCAALALAPNMQVRRIRRHALLTKALISASVETAGGPQVMNVLLVWGIPMWLADIRLAAVAPLLRVRLEIFQQEVADALYRHFILRAEEMRLAVDEPPGPSRWQLAQALEGLDGRVSALEARVDDLAGRLAAVEEQTVYVTERLVEMGGQMLAVVEGLTALRREVAGVGRSERLLAATIERLLSVERRVWVLERDKRFYLIQRARRSSRHHN